MRCSRVGLTATCVQHYLPPCSRVAQAGWRPTCQAAPLLPTHLPVLFFCSRVAEAGRGRAGQAGGGRRGGAGGGAAGVHRWVWQGKRLVGARQLAAWAKEQQLLVQTWLAAAVPAACPAAATHSPRPKPAAAQADCAALDSIPLRAEARAESVSLRSELASVQSELSGLSNKLAAESSESELVVVAELPLYLSASAFAFCKLGCCRT